MMSYNKSIISLVAVSETLVVRCQKDKRVGATLNCKTSSTFIDSEL